MAISATIEVAESSPIPIRPPTASTPPSDNYLINFRDAMIDRYRDRNSDFQTLVDAWHGSLYVGNSNRRWNMDSAGKPILRDWDRPYGDSLMPHNIYKGFVDAYKRGLVQLPDARFPRPAGKFPKDLEGQKQAEAWSERMRRAGYGFWAYSQMDIQNVMAAWWDTVCGSHGVVLMPDFDRGIPKIMYVAPWNIYGVGKLGDPVALSRFIVTSEEDPLAVASEFPDEADQQSTFRPRSDLSPSGESGDVGRGEAGRAVQHSIYFDENWFCRMIGDKVVKRDYHGLGFAPGLIPPLILLPGYVNRGHSVAEQVIPMQRSIDYSVNIWEAGMKDAIFKTAWVKDPINVPDNWARGKGMLITLTADGDVGEFGGDPNALKMVSDHFKLMSQMASINTGVSSSALQGQMSGGGPTSGRGLEKGSGPYLASLEEIQITKAIFMSRELLYAFKMAADPDFWEDEQDTPVKFDGVLRGQAIDEVFTRAELADVSAIEILFAPMAHLGLHERVTIALQLYNTKPPVLSWQRIIELTGLVDDIEVLRSQIESDQKWRMQIMAEEVKAQQPAPPPGPGGAGGGGGDPTALGSAMQAGATNGATLTRAGATGAQPAAPGPAAAPGAEIPAAGAPTGAPAPGPDGKLTDQQVLDPKRLEQLFAQPPETKGKPSETGLGKGDLASELEADLAAILSELNGDVVLVGSTVYVNWKDKNRVTKQLGHQKDLKIKVMPSTPVKGTVVASPGAKGGATPPPSPQTPPPQPPSQ
jgi:hypothetical protein